MSRPAGWAARLGAGSTITRRRRRAPHGDDGSGRVHGPMSPTLEPRVGRRQMTPRRTVALGTAQTVREGWTMVLGFSSDRSRQFACAAAVLALACIGSSPARAEFFNDVRRTFKT